MNGYEEYLLQHLLPGKMPTLVEYWHQKKSTSLEYEEVIIAQNELQTVKGLQGKGGKNKMMTTAVNTYWVLLFIPEKIYPSSKDIISAQEPLW